MTEKELKNIILERYSNEVCDELCNDMREHFVKASDWEAYSAALLQLAQKGLPENEFLDRAFVLPIKNGYVIFD